MSVGSATILRLPIEEELLLAWLRALGLPFPRCDMMVVFEVSEMNGGKEKVLMGAKCFCSVSDAQFSRSVHSRICLHRRQHSSVASFTGEDIGTIGLLSPKDLK